MAANEREALRWLPAPRRGAVVTAAIHHHRAGG